MARRIDISSDRELAALQSIRSALSRARPPARFFRIRVRARKQARPRPYDTGTPPRTHDPSPTAVKALGFTYLATLEERYGPVVDPPATHAALDLDALVFDRAALLALARGNTSARVYLERALSANVRVVAPATVLLDTRAFDVAREVAPFVDIVAIDADVAMAAARLVADVRLDLPLDALTVACVPFSAKATFVTGDAPAVGTFVRATGRTDAVWTIAPHVAR